MNRWWVRVAVVMLVAFCGTSVHAATTYVYHHEQTVAGGNGFSPLGRPIAGLDGWREIVAGQRGLLTPAERQSLQPVVRYHALLIPNDPQYPYQWNLAAMNMPGAWDQDQVAPVYGGDPRIVVAVLDTGLASTVVGAAHSVPDFADSTVWTNPNEVPGDGIDNDHDGFVDDVHGWNFVGNTSMIADDNQHGTHIANTVAEQMNNGLDSTGVAPAATIMPLKVLDSAGDGSTQTLTSAINFAVEHGANIINLSLGGDQDDPVFHQAIQNAVAHGVVVIAAAGNSGTSPITYPARYPEVISVGATQADSTLAPYSNYGSDVVLVAPGGNDQLDQNHDGQADGILAQSCLTGACTNFGSLLMVGTSQAAAQVSGVAALLESCGANASAIRGLLTSTATDLGAPGRDAVYGFGLVNASAALQAAGCNAGAPIGPTTITATIGPQQALPVVSYAPESVAQPLFHWTGGGPTYHVTWSSSTKVIADLTTTATSQSFSVAGEGLYTLRVTSVDAANRESASQQFVYRYQKPTIVVGAGPQSLFLARDLSVAKSISLAKTGAFKTTGADLQPGQKLNLMTSTTGAAVQIRDTNGKVLRTIYPFGTGFGGQVLTAMTRDQSGQIMIVAATGTGGSSLAWFRPDGSVLARKTVFARDPSGLTLAVGDLLGQGYDQVIVGQAVGAHIFVYGSDRTVITDLTPRGGIFHQGWVVAAGDVNGDGRAEIILSPNVPQKIPKVLLLDVDGHALGTLSVPQVPANQRLAMQAYDLTGDGQAEIIVGTLQASPTIAVLNNRGKLLTKTQLLRTTLTSLSHF